ncbi:Uncharacterised protein [Sphingobacterium mizutaii]|uniref:Uncharacterized protein n=1 Tax=Sphingobacterium mizutaii TaxID=1010 RepID=A0AAJ5C188_9SPHI|nr:hypothetical protein SAMN05192578_102375 [Sphingobacterium mizutaii]SNV54452.1 Uncharacterised protein [Sphingobacterium mizutaii]
MIVNSFFCKIFNTLHNYLSKNNLNILYSLLDYLTYGIFKRI